MASVPAVIMHSDVKVEVEEFAVKKAHEALVGSKVEKDQAQYIKKAMEAYNGGLWHVIVGSSFGLSVSHENNSLLLFKIGKACVLVFQTFDESSLVRKDGAAQVHKKVEKKTDDEEEGDT